MLDVKSIVLSVCDSFPRPIHFDFSIVFATRAQFDEAKAWVFFFKIRRASNLGE